MKRFCKDLKENVTKIINYEKKEMIPLTDKKNKSYYMIIWLLFYNQGASKKIEGQFECLGEITEKYINFSVPIKKELDNGKTITYKLEFTDSFRLMSTSWSKLVDNSSEFYSKNVEIKTVNLSVSLKGLKITDFLIIAKSVEKNN